MWVDSHPIGLLTTLTTLNLSPHNISCSFCKCRWMMKSFSLYPIGHTSPKWRPDILISLSGIWINVVSFIIIVLASITSQPKKKCSTHKYSIIKDALKFYSSGWSDQHRKAWESLDWPCDVWLIDGWLEAACCSRQRQMRPVTEPFSQQQDLMFLPY